MTSRMSVERFCATTPLWRTTSGSRGSAIATRLLTSMTALSAFGADLERAVDRQRAVGRRGRAEIDQVLDAGQLLLDRRRDGARERLGAGTRVVRGDDDRGRRDLGILRDRQHLRRDQARERDDDRDDAGEYRPVDEEFGERHDENALLRRRCGRCRRCGGRRGGASVTGAPGRTFSRLSVITRSPAFSPDRIVQSVPTQSPVCTGIGCALPSASTTKTSCRFLGLHDGGLRHQEDVVALAGVDRRR